ncbi:MAG TPA: hypothetical protein P5514_15595 [Bacteroidales bacterium]|nr:hypothetical protein [Bacteroidales bacterium]HPE57070.1 hypothetical protein [Bacteroidales bacterium]HRX98369.1 hypothetical protein [Bacteroidales bacterium]
MADENIKTGFQNLKDAVATAIKDLASLEVTTYSGDFDLTFADVKEKDENAFKIKSLLEAKEADLNAKLHLVAYSRFEIDADASNIVKHNLTEEERMLIEVHKEMVLAAQESRRAMFAFAKDLLNLKF